MEFGVLNGVPSSPTLKVLMCKRTISMIARPKSFAQKKSSKFLLHIMMVGGLDLEVPLLNVTSSHFAMMT
jgi:hypothetical protein